jgi:Cu-Zn family superoxide dismutase
MAAGAATAAVTVPMSAVDEKGVGAAVGTVEAHNTAYGLVLTPDLEGLPPGLHGFHVHQKPSCEPAEKDGKLTPAQAAGGHYDPDQTGKHGAPWDDQAHRGDMPPLYVDASGKAHQPVLAPRLKEADVKGRSIMIHAGGDNHADAPQPLGGGGGRIACGVVP